MKTISLSELLAKATPGPYGIKECPEEYELNGQGWSAFAVIFKNEDDALDQQSTANAALLAHAANQIGPLVDALELAWQHSDVRCSIYADKITAALAAAKNVEVQS